MPQPNSSQRVYLVYDHLVKMFNRECFHKLTKARHPNLITSSESNIFSSRIVDKVSGQIKNQVQNLN